MVLRCLKPHDAVALMFCMGLCPFFSLQEYIETQFFLRGTDAFFCVISNWFFSFSRKCCATFLWRESFIVSYVPVSQQKHIYPARSTNIAANGRRHISGTCIHHRLNICVMLQTCAIPKYANLVFLKICCNMASLPMPMCVTTSRESFTVGCVAVLQQEDTHYVTSTNKYRSQDAKAYLWEPSSQKSSSSTQCWKETGQAKASQSQSASAFLPTPEWRGTWSAVD